MNRRIALIGIYLSLLLTGCGSESATVESGLRTVPMQIGSKQFTLEVADSFSTREHGLMQRDSMPELHGMIFVFEDETDRDFYMKNTRFPLEILFLDHTGKIVSISTMQPYDLSLTSSGGAAKYAIELNVGSTQKVGVKVGQVLDVPTDAKEPKK